MWWDAAATREVLVHVPDNEAQYDACNAVSSNAVESCAAAMRQYSCDVT